MNYLESAKIALNKGKLSGAKALLTKHLEKEHRTIFYKNLEEEYNNTYPSFILKECIGNCTTGTPCQDCGSNGQYIGTIETEVDYSNDENYMTFDQWINETKVVSEAVEEISHIEVIDDVETKIIDQEYTPEVIELIRPYNKPEITDEMINLELEKYEEYSQYKKNQKEETINKLIVENNGVKLDAHNTGRADMTGVLAVANFKFNQLVTSKLGSGMNITQAYQEAYDEVYKDTVSWKGSDNTVHNIQIESVGESAFKAFDSYAKIIGAK